MVKSQLQKAFPSSELLSNQSPDELVAIGAAKEAGILIAGEDEDREQNGRETRVPCLPGDILVQVGLNIARPEFKPILHYALALRFGKGCKAHVFTQRIV